MESILSMAPYVQVTGAVCTVLVRRAYRTIPHAKVQYVPRNFKVCTVLNVTIRAIWNVRYTRRTICTVTLCILVVRHYMYMVCTQHV